MDGQREDFVIVLWDSAIDLHDLQHERYFNDWPLGKFCSTCNKVSSKPFPYYQFNKTDASLLGFLTPFTMERNLYQSINSNKLQRKDTSFASLKVMLHSSQDTANAHAADYN